MKVKNDSFILKKILNNMSNGTKIGLVTLFFIFILGGLSVFLIHLSYIDRQKVNAICAPDHYVSEIELNVLSKIICMNDEGKERFIIIKK